MNFNFNMLNKLLEILEYDTFDATLYTKFIELNEVKDFIEHDQLLGRKTDVETLKIQLQNTINGSTDTMECNGFNVIRNNIDKLKNELRRVQMNEENIKERILTKINKYCQVDRLNDITIYLYGGGLDYGYSNESGKTYVNTGNLVDNMQYFDDVMAHECYHSRIRKGEILDYDFSKERYLKTLLFHILEEGFATLIQFEYPKAYEEFAFITKDYFDKTDLYFKKFDYCIKEIELKNNYSKEYIIDYFGNSIPNYVVGYRIAQVLFEHGGKELLNKWSIDEDYIYCFKTYISILREKQKKTGFSTEVEDYLLSL